MSLKQLAERVLLSCPAYKGQTSLPLFIPGELTTVRWGFALAVSAYCSHRRRVKRCSRALWQARSGCDRVSRLLGSSPPS